MKLSVRLSPLLRLRAPRFSEPDLAATAFVLEKSGIASIELDAVSEPSPELWRELQRMRETVAIPFAIRTTADKAVVEKYLELHPERITLCDSSDNGIGRPLSLGESQFELPETIKLIREHGGECFVKLAPNLSDLKKAVKYQCFGIELDSRDWLTLHGHELRSAQDTWRDAALAGWKLGLTIQCETPIHSETLAVLHAVPEVGRLVLGDDFWAKSVLHGVDQTVIGIRNAM